MSLLSRAAVICLCGVVAAPPLGTATDDSPGTLDRSERSGPSHLVVLRLSRSMLASLLDKPIDVQLPVRDQILGTPIQGAARITGQLKLDLAPSPNQARFAIHCNGAVYTRTVGE